MIDLRINSIIEKLSHSKFRASFKLTLKDFGYVQKKGLDTIRTHAADFIDKRLSQSYIANDGKQTPTKGHPVFIAQHATATCCRNCLYKWHHIPEHVEFTNSQRNYVVDVIMTWIETEMKKNDIDD